MFSTPTRRRIGWAAIYFCVAVFVLLVLYVVASTRVLAEEVRDTQLEGTPTGQKLLTASDRILDCTDPEGQCFQDSQERTAKVVGDINRVIVLAAACSVGLDADLPVNRRQILIQECIINRLAVQGAKP